MLDFHNLHRYQHTSCEHIEGHPFALLMLKMGLGKTVATLTAFNALKYEQFSVDAALVVAPKAIVHSVWRQEAQKWRHLQHLKVVRVIGTPKQRIAALRTPCDIHVIGVDVLPWLAAQYPDKLPWDMLILDELSCFKNADTGRFKALKMMAPNFKRRIGLTGTPAPNSLLELWPQVYLLDLGERLGKFISHYRNKYFVGDAGYGSGGASFTKYKPKAESEQLIYDAIGDITLSLGLEYLDMPEKVDVNIEVELPEKLMKQYKAFKREAYTQIMAETGSSQGEVTAMTAATLTGKLLQFCNGAIYDADRNVLEVHDAKLDALETIIDAADGSPVLVLYAYQHDRDRILRRFAKRGAQAKEDDESVERWNRGEIPIMLMHPKSGGHGINLQAGGNTMVWFGMTWSLELYEQTVARLYRQGQVSATVTIYHLLSKGTMDERVMKILEDKQAGQEALMSALKQELRDF